MSWWRKLLGVRESAASTVGEAEYASFDGRPRGTQCIWCGASPIKQVGISLKSYKFAFDVCSDRCEGAIAGLFAEGTNIYKMVFAIADGAEVRLPPNALPVVARLKESIERQLRSS